MINIFIDFAETLGFRVLPEIETDFKIVSNVLGIFDQRLKDDYENYCFTSNLYDRSLTFESFKEEMDLTTRHFAGFLKKRPTVNNVDQKAKKISELKYLTLTHALYPDVKPALENYKKMGNIFIVSDGRPSRRNTLNLLNLDCYAKTYFISDEVGYLKNDKNFYLLIMKQIDLSDKVYFIDDLVSNLDTFTEVRDVDCILVDRKNVYEPSQVKYSLVNKLPLEL